MTIIVVRTADTTTCCCTLPPELPTPDPALPFVRMAITPFAPRTPYRT
jgi:hypothetical protein